MYTIKIFQTKGNKKCTICGTKMPKGMLFLSKENKGSYWDWPVNKGRPKAIATFKPANGLSICPVCLEKLSKEALSCFDKALNRDEYEAKRFVENI